MPGVKCRRDDGDRLLRNRSLSQPAKRILPVLSSQLYRMMHEPSGSKSELQKQTITTMPRGPRGELKDDRQCFGMGRTDRGQKCTFRDGKNYNCCRVEADDSLLNSVQRLQYKSLKLQVQFTFAALDASSFDSCNERFLSFSFWTLNDFSLS